VIKVLVVDDSALVRRLLGHALSSEPEFEVVFARNGIEALDMLKREWPDVVTLDIQMPQMDGLTCLDRIMIERPTPVVMVSSLAIEGAEATLEALRLGAVDFLLKPDGAVSLKMDVFAPQVVAKVCAAAGVRLRATKRLRERIAYNIGAAQSTSTVRRAPAAHGRSARARNRPEFLAGGFPLAAGHRATHASELYGVARRPTGSSLQPIGGGGHACGPSTAGERLYRPGRWRCGDPPPERRPCGSTGGRAGLPLASEHRPVG
jgi:CheY-like chemotaxis protein